MNSIPFPIRLAVDALNSLLQGEISATETYRQAIEKLDDERLFALQENLDSHRGRVRLLRDRVIEMGGEPASGSGLWGAFAKLVEGSAKLFGRDTAISALEEGEDRGLADYRKSLERLDSDSRTLVEEVLLPAQERTHQVMREMKAGSSAYTKSGRTDGFGRTLLLAAALTIGALSMSGCHDKRHVRIEEVTPQAHSTISRIVGTDTVSEISEEKCNGISAITWWSIAVVNG